MNGQRVLASHEMYDSCIEADDRTAIDHVGIGVRAGQKCRAGNDRQQEALHVRQCGAWNVISSQLEVHYLPHHDANDVAVLDMGDDNKVLPLRLHAS